MPLEVIISVSLFSQAEGFQTLVVADVARDASGGNHVEVFLKVGADGAVLGGIAAGKLNVSFAFNLQDEGSPAFHGLFGLGNVDDILTILVASESALVLKVVEAHHVGDAVSLGGTEADAAQDAGNEGDEGIFLGAVGDFAHLDKFGSEEQTADVGFGFLPLAVLLAKGFAHALTIGDGVFDTQAVSYLVEADVAEEGVEVDIVELVIADKEVGYGHKNVYMSPLDNAKWYVTSKLKSLFMTTLMTSGSESNIFVNAYAYPSN